jgi:hypothetical protein
MILFFFFFWNGKIYYNRIKLQNVLSPRNGTKYRQYCISTKRKRNMPQPTDTINRVHIPFINSNSNNRYMVWMHHKKDIWFGSLILTCFNKSQISVLRKILTGYKISNGLCFPFLQINLKSLTKTTIKCFKCYSLPSHQGFSWEHHQQQETSLPQHEHIQDLLYTPTVIC